MPLIDGLLREPIAATNVSTVAAFVPLPHHLPRDVVHDNRDVPVVLASAAGLRRGGAVLFHHRILPPRRSPKLAEARPVERARVAETILRSLSADGLEAIEDEEDDREARAALDEMKRIGEKAIPLEQVKR